MGAGLQFREVVVLVHHDHVKKKKKNNNNNNKITQRSRKVPPWGVPFVSLPYELFLAASGQLLLGSMSYVIYSIYPSLCPLLRCNMFNLR